MQRVEGVLVKLAKFLNRSRLEPVAWRNKCILFDRQRHLVAQGSPPSPRFAANSTLVFPGTGSPVMLKSGGVFPQGPVEPRFQGRCFTGNNDDDKIHLLQRLTKSHTSSLREAA